MTNDEKRLRDELEAVRGTDRELEGYERISAKVSKAPRAVFSLRVGADEMVEIEAAARSIGQNVGEFIREAALLHARNVSKNEAAISAFLIQYDQTCKALGDLGDLAHRIGIPVPLPRYTSADAGAHTERLGLVSDTGGSRYSPNEKKSGSE